MLSSGLSRRGSQRAPVLVLLVALIGCGPQDRTPADRVAEVVAPLPRAASGDEAVAISGTLQLDGGTIFARRVSPTPLIPERVGVPGAPVIVEFEATGLEGVEGRLGLLPPRAAARQEVGSDTPGQPADPRSVWIDVELGPDGAQRFELPAPGPTWHAAEAVVALELRRGRSRVSVLAGPRSEMVSDQTRATGGRAILAVVPVERRPARLEVPRASSTITLDGELREAAWQGEGAVLVHSLHGEPTPELDERLGGPTRVWFAWDTDALYVAASIPDPDLFAEHRERDDPLYRDEAFEVFFAADGSGARYLEHQISARGVMFDARFPKYREGDEAWDGTWRGAVALDGELARRGGDRGWTVELAFAWSELCADTEIACPPRPGQELRANVFRLEKPDRKGQVGLALSPTLEPDFHAWRNAAALVLLDRGEQT